MSLRLSRRALIALICTCIGLAWTLGSPSVRAQPKAAEPAREAGVPPELQPWIPWVLQGGDADRCAKLNGTALCAWPGAVEFDVREGGAEFRLSATVDAETWLPLPGSFEHWPLDVELDGKPAVVLAKDKAPSVRLTRGEHQIRGAFRWTNAPETLPVPGTVALVRLRVRGESVPFPRREASGALWLQAGSSASSAEAERVEVELFRRLADGVPLTDTTRLVLRASGAARELRLPNPLLGGARLVTAEAPLPLRFEPNGELVLQLRAGEHAVVLTSVLPRPPDKLAAKAHPSPWPPQEIWAWVPATELRQVVVSGAPNVDPAQTNLPEEWRKSAAYVLTPGRSLRFETVRRGEANPPPNRLTLTRNIWVDLDGSGFSLLDELTGNVHRDYRLDLSAAPLGRAVVDGTDALITVHEGKTGVELRKGRAELRAEWRLARSGLGLPAVGWNADFDSLSARLHLPPGWELLGASGVDSASSTWISDWTLWGFFFVLITSLAVHRLVGFKWAAVALVTLVLSHGRDQAPELAWFALALVAGLLHALPQGKVRAVTRALAFVVAVTLAVIVVRFVVYEIRLALFPNTAEAHSSESIATGELSLAAPKAEAEAERGAEPGAPPMPQEETEGGSGLRSRVADYAQQASGSSKKGKYKLQEPVQDPEAVIQTGPGLPKWRWNTVELGWSGPVERGQELTLYLLPPWLTSLFGVLRAALAAVLAFILIQRIPWRPVQRRLTSDARVAAAAAALVLLLWPAQAHAEPSPAVLDQLKTRLTPPVSCDVCVEVAELDLDMQADGLRASADVHAGSLVAYQLPGPASSWVPSAVRVDGRPSSALLLGTDGFLYLRLETGRHRVELDGPVAGNELTLALGSPPRYVSARGSAWEVDGVRDGHAEGSVHFARREKAAPGAEAIASRINLPPWLSVVRTFELGLNWRITTELNRVSPPGEPLNLRVPLLPGEEVTEPGAIVENQQLVVTLARDERNTSFSSVLKPRPKLELVAPSDRPWSEEWRIQPSALWHPSFNGLAPVERLAEGTYAPRFRPWPGERLNLDLVRPPPAPGSSRTIDAAKLVITPGQRLVAAQLELGIRTSKGGNQSLTLPAGARVQSLTVDGRAEPIRLAGDRLEVALTPGSHALAVTWHQPGGTELAFSTPPVDLGGPATNARVRLELPADRWLLFTTGPAWGPKVLLFAYALLVLGAAFVLIRLPANPLRIAQWWLLGMGLTQVPLVVALLIASWFFVVALPGRAAADQLGWRRLALLGLPLWTLVFLGCLVATVYMGLVNNPDMIVQGAYGDSFAGLEWYADRVSAQLPSATVISAPLWVWRVLNLFWALWLAMSLLGWLRWAWTEYERHCLSVPLWPFRAAPAGPPPAPATRPAPPVDADGGAGAPPSPEASPPPSPEDPQR
jgi:hypothetical protein